MDVAEFLHRKIVLGEEEFGVGDGPVQEVAIEVLLPVVPEQPVDGGQHEEEQDCRQEGELEGEPVADLHVSSFRT